jgi:hypothetical protein
MFSRNLFLFISFCAATPKVFVVPKAQGLGPFNYNVANFSFSEPSIKPVAAALSSIENIPGESGTILVGNGNAPPAASSPAETETNEPIEELVVSKVHLQPPSVIR